MALSNLPQVATVSGVYTPRDFTQQLNDMASNSANALRNAFDFAMDLQNESIKNKQSKLMDDEIKRQEILKENQEIQTLDVRRKWVIDQSQMMKRMRPVKRILDVDN